MGFEGSNRKIAGLTRKISDTRRSLAYAIKANNPTCVARFTQKISALVQERAALKSHNPHYAPLVSTPSSSTDASANEPSRYHRSGTFKRLIRENHSRSLPTSFFGSDSFTLTGDYQ